MFLTATPAGAPSSQVGWAELWFPAPSLVAAFPSSSLGCFHTQKKEWILAPLPEASPAQAQLRLVTREDTEKPLVLQVTFLAGGSPIAVFPSKFLGFDIQAKTFPSVTFPLARSGVLCTSLGSFLAGCPRLHSSSASPEGYITLPLGVS